MTEEIHKIEEVRFPILIPSGSVDDSVVHGEYAKVKLDPETRRWVSNKLLTRNSVERYGGQINFEKAVFYDNCDDKLEFRLRKDIGWRQAELSVLKEASEQLGDLYPDYLMMHTILRSCVPSGGAKHRLPMGYTDNITIMIQAMRDI